MTLQSERLISRDSDGASRYVWQLSLDDLTDDIDRIIPVGGPTNSSYFRDHSSKTDSAQTKILTPSDVLPEIGRDTEP